MKQMQKQASTPVTTLPLMHTVEETAEEHENHNNSMPEETKLEL